MSVSLSVYKGETYNDEKSDFIIDIPVSFQRIWNEGWELLISKCRTTRFVIGGMFTVNDLPIILDELEKVYEYICRNNISDKEYIQNRIKELKQYLKK